MKLRESSQKREARLVRTSKAKRKKTKRVSRRAECASACKEWAEDYAGTHSVFGD